MGNCQEKDKIEQAGSNDRIVMLINVMAEISPFLARLGMGLRKGIVFFAENPEIADTFWTCLERAGSIPIKSLKKTASVPNSRIGLYRYRLYAQEWDILEFLDSDNFMPAILCHSFIPDFLQTGYGLISCTDIGDIQQEELECFRKFIHKNPSFVQQGLQFFQTSNLFEKLKKGDGLLIALTAAAEIFCYYYRRTHDEAETETLRALMHDEIAHQLDYAERYLGNWDIFAAIKSAVKKFIDENPKICFGDEGSIEGVLAKALQDGMAVLHDDKYYYWPEKLLKAACEPLCEAVSYLTVKNELAAGGYLHCNSPSQSNFTVKKVLYNGFGSRFRQRFLVLKKDFFDVEGELELWQRRENICSQGYIMEENAG